MRCCSARFLIRILDQLVRIATERDRGGYLSLPYFTALKDHNRSFSGVAAYGQDSFNLTGRGEAEQIGAERETGNLFDVLGVRPVAGRVFLPEEDQPGGNLVVMISAELAARLFNGEQDAIGRNLSLDSKDWLTPSSENVLPWRNSARRCWDASSIYLRPV